MTEFSPSHPREQAAATNRVSYRDELENAHRIDLSQAHLLHRSSRSRFWASPIFIEETKVYLLPDRSCIVLEAVVFLMPDVRKSTVSRLPLGRMLTLREACDWFVEHDLDLPEKLSVQPESQQEVPAICGSGDAAEKRQIAAAAKQGAPVRKDQGKGRRPRVGKREYNLRAREALKGEPPNEKNWTQRALAGAIGCSSGMVSRLDAYNAYAEEHGISTAKGRRTVSLTPAITSNLGDSDVDLERLKQEQIEQLAREQAADLEPSPLVTGRARIRIHKKL